MLLARISAQGWTLSLTGCGLSPDIADLASFGGAKTVGCRVAEQPQSDPIGVAEAFLPLLMIALGENASDIFELWHCHATGQSSHKYCFINGDYLLDIGC